MKASFKLPESEIRRQLAEIQNDIEMLLEDPENENATDIRILKEEAEKLNGALSLLDKTN